ncbi:hypothetical protein RIF29_11211 [Crotalaria pallida]|uniref:Transmembrane protein n=1 Tax=Crotalaria pallida TaxID=3830 RepID=A0AAN9ILW8_CROPI
MNCLYQQTRIVAVFPGPIFAVNKVSTLFPSLFFFLHPLLERERESRQTTPYTVFQLRRVTSGHSRRLTFLLPHFTPKLPKKNPFVSTLCFHTSLCSSLFHLLYFSPFRKAILLYCSKLSSLIHSTFKSNRYKKKKTKQKKKTQLLLFFLFGSGKKKSLL